MSIESELTIGLVSYKFKKAIMLTIKLQLKDDKKNEVLQKLKKNYHNYRNIRFINIMMLLFKVSLKKF